MTTKWKINNPEKVKEANKNWNLKNHERANQLSKEWREKNPLKRSLISKKWLQSHPEYHKQWNLKNPEKYKLSKRKARLSRYNLTIEQFNNLLTQQNNKCSICNCKLIKTNTCVDHCHKTNLIRGIICNTCNSGLGFLKDDINNLQNAIIYLNKFNKLNNVKVIQ